MRLIITEAAQNDLQEIADYIARENPLRAVSFLDELQVRLTRLTFMPYTYSLVPR